MEVAFLNFLISWGPTAVSGLLVFVVSFLIRYIIANSKKEEERAASIRNEIKEILADVNHTLNSFGARLTAVENEYIKNDFFFREMQGWRSEINRVSDQITTCFTTLTQNIFQILSRGNNGT